MATNWVHCNKCFVSYNPKVRFFVTECGHIECELCAKRIQAHGNKCAICMRDTSAVLIEKNMKPELQFFFGNPMQAMDKTRHMVRFQLNNYNSAFKVLNHKYTRVKSDFMKLKTQYDKVVKDYTQLRVLYQQRTVPHMASGQIRSGAPPVNSTPQSYNASHWLPPYSSTQLSNAGPSSVIMESQLSSIRKNQNNRPQSRPLSYQVFNTPQSCLQTPSASINSRNSGSTSGLGLSKMSSASSVYRKLV